MKKALRFLLILLLIIAAAIGLGPRPDRPALKASLPTVPESPLALASWVEEREQDQPYLKPDNEARLVWADSLLRTPTRYSLLYLHGFSASQEEGAAMARSVAARYGYHLYLSRLQAHGLEEPEPLLSLDADSLYASAVEALAVAQTLGEEVLIMSTSTGGTLSLKLAAEFPEQVAGLILYSPNIRMFDTNTQLLTYPWGLQVARQVVGSGYREYEADAFTQQYWNARYRLEAVQALQLLVENSMLPETFAAVKCPVFLGYYFKNETEQDHTVSVPAMLEMYEQLGTAAEKKRKQAFPAAKAHVIAHPRESNAFEAVQVATFAFLEEVMQLPVTKTEPMPVVSSPSGPPAD